MSTEDTLIIALISILIGITLGKDIVKLYIEYKRYKKEVKKQ